MQKETEPQQLIEPSFEQKLLQSELVYSGQVTLRKVLDKKGTDAVGLLDIPVNFEVRDLGNTTGYIASFPKDQASFGGSRLIQVLEGAKPIRENEEQMSQYRDGVINDWTIMLERSRKANISYANLYKDHIAPDSIISRHFEEFGRNHFTQFWDAINSSTRDLLLEEFDKEYSRLMFNGQAPFTAYDRLTKSYDQVEIRYGGFYMKVRFEVDKKTGREYNHIVGIYTYPQEGEISPVIIWEADRTTNERKYFCGEISPKLIEAFPDLFFPRQDTLFGQIAVAVYSDDLKLILPTKLPLVKGGKKQDMLEAQMPVFVSLFADKYLNRSPVIAGFEALARQSKN